LKSETDLRHRGFQGFPFHKSDLVIVIYAPNLDDPDQLVLLWQKIDVLIQVIGESTSFFKSLTIRLLKSPPTDWLRNGDRQANESIKYPDNFYPDHNVVIIPFCRLQSVQELLVVDGSEQDNAMDRTIIDYAMTFISKNGSMSSGKPKAIIEGEYAAIDRYFANIDCWVTDMAFFLDTELDTLPG
jgi:hypothetical protein